MDAHEVLNQLRLSIWTIPVIIFCTLAVTLLSKLSERASKPSSFQETGKSITLPIKSLPAHESYGTIEPLRDFKWENTKPLKLRPFKSKYYLTMALENLNMPSFIEIDQNYLDRINLRRQVMFLHPKVTLGADESVKPAVDEFYTWLVGSYLPARYPTMFRLSDASEDTGVEPCLINLVNETEVYLTPPDDPISSLTAIGGLVEDDFLFLLPSTDGDGYTLRGFVTCFPNGFDTSQKCGLKLRDIHKPVPGYAEKIGLSMDRYFEKLEVGKIVRRANWSITTNDRLFAPSGNHLYLNEEAPEERFDVQNTFLRCERQTLHRLPISKAIVFSFKTLVYPVSEVKAEGSGEDLAQAIEGLERGNVPDMHFYKRAVVWGDNLKEYLRS